MVAIHLINVLNGGYKPLQTPSSGGATLYRLRILNGHFRYVN